MKRLPVLGGGMVTAAVLWAAWAGPVRGDEGNDDGLARQLLAAAGKHADLQEVTTRYGRRAELALAILEREQYQVELQAEVGNMNTVIATYPQSRRRWLVEQWDYFNMKQARVQELNELKRQLGQLRVEEKRLYEEELQKARASGQRVKTLNRPAILAELQRAEKDSQEANDALKAALESAARDRGTTPRQVLQAAAGRTASLKTAKSPDVDRDFLPYFKKLVGEYWLDGKKAPPGKAKKGSNRTKKTNRARSGDASS